ncbi:hypothetical protein HFO45_18200 [Rhizobium leguminosarum]|uniref:hypothetical protein n=1 Tax=Rhizobium TaxID=379 RepID=UPI001C919295|nr:MULTISPECIES: hypothetical protein [Rhizobium]MBY3136957.1 hypothetical protein [Rhizobium laguerreae]MBY5587107.1 hypothetical protein [Rhizobium leguminosarum]MBY5601993.1 hypothetical protein [Rhizobium leguminosarum]MBY5650181.1 hypothetical protein [Rhizobium leguminosarum]MBY5698071.1 hypothetical protein [Rhizobium leguminosarum]
MTCHFQAGNASSGQNQIRGMEMAENTRDELDRLMQELSALDERERTAPPTSDDPKRAKEAASRKSELLARIRVLEDELRDSGS